MIGSVKEGRGLKIDVRSPLASYQLEDDLIADPNAVKKLGIKRITTMQRDYTQFEIETLAPDVKRQIEQLMYNHSNYGIVAFAIQVWADRIDEIPQKLRTTEKLKHWSNSLKQMCEEIDMAIEGDGPPSI